MKETEEKELNIQLDLTINGQMSALELVVEVLGQLTYCEFIFENKSKIFRKYARDIFKQVQEKVKKDEIRGISGCGKFIESYLNDEKRIANNKIRFTMNIHVMQGTKYT